MKVIYPGSFDPITLGHLDIITRCAEQFEEVVVAVLKNPQKKGLFEIAERVDMIEHSVEGISNVSVMAFSGLLVDCAEKVGCRGIIRGLRAISDYEYEMQMALVNRKLSPSLETFFMVSEGEYAYLSSSIVKEIAGLKGEIKSFVPPYVYIKLKERLGAR